MTVRLNKTDVVLIGLGGVGGLAVLPLAESGLEVVALEAGTWLSPRDFAPDELRNEVHGWPQSVQKANQEIPVHRATSSSPDSPRIELHPMMNAVGGTTMHWWAQSWRLNPWDFKVVSETTRRYGASRIPVDSTVEDWPLELEDLEWYYDKVEHEIGVSGQAGNVKGVIDRRGNINGCCHFKTIEKVLEQRTNLLTHSSRKLGFNLIFKHPHNCIHNRVDQKINKVQGTKIHINIKPRYQRPNSYYRYKQMVRFRTERYQWNQQYSQNSLQHHHKY